MLASRPVDALPSEEKEGFRFGTIDWSTLRPGGQTREAKTQYKLFTQPEDDGLSTTPGGQTREAKSQYKLFTPGEVIESLSTTSGGQTSQYKLFTPGGVIELQQPEDDGLSETSTIEYYYSEEEYPRSDLDLDHTDSEEEDDSEDEDNEGDVGLNESVPAEENKEEGIDTTYSTPTEENKEVSKYNYTVPSRRCVSCDMWHLENRGVSCDMWPDKDEWVASWKVDEPPPSPWTWINVYAYFNKAKGYGGYGVILRNALAKPIAASAKYSEDAKSFYYQVFLGIKAGVTLAEKHKLSDLHVLCNSIKAPAYFRICCCAEKYLNWYEGCDMRLVVPLVMELEGKNIVELLSAGATNSAAHHLAKAVKNSWMRRKNELRRCVMEQAGTLSALEIEERFQRYWAKLMNTCSLSVEIKLDYFSGYLKKILWIDAFGSPYFRSVV